MIDCIKPTIQNRIILILFVLHYTRFYNLGVYQANPSIILFIDIIFNILFLFYFTKLGFRDNTPLSRCCDLLYTMFLLSIPIGMLGGQSFYYGFRGLQPNYMLFGVFYYLKYYEIDYRYIIKLLLYLAIGYIVTDVLCYIQFPNTWFGITSRVDEDFNEQLKAAQESRGMLRFLLPCKILIPFLIFYLLNNFNFRLKDFVKLIIAVIFLLLIGFRFLIVSTILFSVAICFTSEKFIGRRLQIVLTSLLLVAFAFFIPFTRNIIESLTAYTVEQNEMMGSEDYRILSFKYFLTEFNGDNVFNIILGNGVPVQGPYADKIQQGHTLAFWESDVGYSEIYIYFGIIGLLTFSYWLLCCCKAQINNEAYFVKIYAICIMFSMIAGGYWFENVPFMAFITYIIFMAEREQEYGLTYYEY